MADQDDDLGNLPIKRLPVITPPLVDPNMIQAVQGGNPLSYTPSPAPPDVVPQVQPVPVNLHPSVSAQHIASMTPPSINDPQYRPSGLRNVLNAIAGGLAGAAGGPQVGMETGAALRDYKYNRAMQDYKNKLALAEAQQKAEQQTFEQAIKPYQVAAPLYTAESLAERRAAQTRQTDIGLGIKRELAQTAARKVDVQAAGQQSQAEHRKAIEKYMQAKLDNPKLDDAQYMFNLPPDEQEAFKKMYQSLHPNQTMDPRTKAYQTAMGRLGAQSSPEGLAAAENIARVQGVGRQAALGTIATPAQQELADQLTAQLVKDPDNYKAILDVAGTNLAVREHALSSYLKGDDLPKQMSTTERTAATNSRTVLSHIENIKSLISDPEVQADLGAIKGRMMKAINAIGTDVLKKGPEGSGVGDIIQRYGATKSAKEEQLLNLLAYLVTFEASSTSGTRPSWQLIHYLNTYSPRPEEDIAHFVGSIKGVEASALTRIKSAGQFTKGGMPMDQNVKTTPQGHEIEILDDPTKKKKE